MEKIMKINRTILALILSAVPVLSGAQGLLTDSVLVEMPTKRAYQTISLPNTAEKDKILATGSANAYYENDLLSYPTTDLRNSFTGKLNGVVIRELNGSPNISFNSDGSKVNVLMRNLTPIYVIDGMPMFVTELQLDPEEIESVTVVRDILDKARYGSRSADGVIHITTKRGQTRGRDIHFGIETGMGLVDRFPGYVDGVEYAKLQNTSHLNSGYAAPYTDEAIAGYALYDPNNLKYPNADYRSLMLKDTKPFYKATFSVSGGTSRLQYYAYLGYAGEGDIYAAGPTSDFNRFNVRSYVNANITDDLRFNIGFNGGVTFRRQPRYADDATTVEFNEVLKGINTIPSIAFPMIISQDEATGVTTYGVSNVYGNNPYANLVERGFSTERGRSGVLTANLSYDFNKLVKGLKFDSYIGLNLYNMVRIGKRPDYLAVIYNPETEEQIKTSHEGAKASGKTNMGKYGYQGLFINERLSYQYSDADNSVEAGVSYYLESSDNTQESFRRRQMSILGNVSYAFRNRYIVEGLVNYIGSSMFKEGRRFKAFPAVGLAWVISNEGFMENATGVNQLKLRAQAGMIGSGSFGSNYLYEDYYVKDKGINFGPYTTGFEWLGSSTKYQSYVNTISRYGNPDLTWETRKEVTVGVDALFLDNRLSLELNGYYTKYDDIITAVNANLPGIFGVADIDVYENYNELSYKGVELALTWADKVGDFRYSVGVDANWNVGRYDKYSETYDYDYQRITGTEVGQYRGYVYMGKFESQEDIDSWPVQMFSNKVEVGDLKYKDLNEDGVVDSNDSQIIGNTTPKFNYALRLNLAYKGFDLTVIGTGRAGFQTALTNEYFWNGWGTDRISNFVRDNVGGDYPRLTYVKQDNNFKASAFWLRDGSYFKIQNVELGYSFNFRKNNAIKGLRIFLRGANLLTISGIKDVDPEYTAAGVSTYPLYKTYTFGLKFKF